MLSGSKAGKVHRTRLITMDNLAGAYLAERRWPEAERTARECVELWETKLPGDWWRFRTVIRYGTALEAQKKYAEAELAYLEGYQGLKAHEAEIPAALKVLSVQAAGRIVNLYAAWGKLEKVAEWRKTLETAAAR
jgi:hypothetical protein